MAHQYSCTYSAAYRRRKYGDSTVADGQDMDENIDIDSDMQLAAVALQNLSCSPASPHFPCTYVCYYLVLTKR